MTHRLDLYVEEPVLGRDSRFVREAGVEFGRPTVHPVAAAELTELARRRPDLRQWHHTVLILPFDLEEPPEGRRYVEATVRATFDDEDVRALNLGEPSYGAAPPGGTADALLLTRGSGRHRLTWQLTAADRAAGMRASGRAVLAVLESPRGTDRLTGVLDARVTYAYTLLGAVNRVKAETREPLPFHLDVSQGDFAFAG
ncbi:hypothetical protein [Actinomadura roseirufa]|uniref:hypothetical protein n=1 Tax=Actinomadura roseirufa TaxID=2094049 RepID=UPI001041675B|nr:hypothetical protein [Actinomadura roseirufa]